MPERNYPPAYLRYLKARLSNFLRPSFWGTGIFLVIVGFVIWESWFNPGFFTQNENKETAKKVVTTKTTEETAKETAISNEDQAIAADIDNMPSLLSDFAEATVSANVTTLRSDTQANNSEPFLEDIINKQNADANQAKSNPGSGIVNQVSPVSAKNPFVEQAETLLHSDRGNSGSQFLGINNLATSAETTEPKTASNLGIGLNNQPINNQTSVVNPLELAIKQSSNITPIRPLINNGGVSPIYTPNSLPYQGLPATSGVGYVQPTVTNMQPNYYNNFNGVQTAPNVGIPTNRVYGVVPNNPYAVQPPIQGVVNNTTPVGYGYYGNYTGQQPGQLPPSNLSYPGQVQPVNNGFRR
ncbi:hypothetical protein H6G06_08750 [Anabaena sphaerica FACHB-251]|uniref:Uncharacterized protein n=1 Tax=Anabaena sphaerica FACHB-251 TaxID=2692883 RepID=A0A926WGA3_9NOST|nr:hypothetical protein [Anabaena sphaerica]MBD2293575.1 hypothetical protein [Anabaena sphaerica FACHB-251]